MRRPPCRGAALWKRWPASGDARALHPAVELRIDIAELSGYGYHNGPVFCGLPSGAWQRAGAGWPLRRRGHRVWSRPAGHRVRRGLKMLVPDGRRGTDLCALCGRALGRAGEAVAALRAAAGEPCAWVALDREDCRQPNLPARAGYLTEIETRAADR